MPEAITKIRDHYDPAWVDRRVGQWLETFYSADIVAVFDADDRIEYFRSRLVGEAAPSDLPVELGPALAVLRRHLSAPPPHAVLLRRRIQPSRQMPWRFFSDFTGRFSFGTLLS